MDPITIVGIASASVQLVDFGCKLLSKSYKIYHDSWGDSIGNDDMLAATKNLLSLTEDINMALSSRSNSTVRRPDEVALLETASSCERVGTELVNISNRIRRTSGSQVWSSIRQAFRSVLKNGEIDDLYRRLDFLRSQLVLNFLVVMSSQGTQELRRLDHVLSASQRALIGAIQETKLHLSSELSQLRSELANAPTQIARQTISTFMNDHKASVSNLSSSVSDAVQSTNDTRIRNRILASLFSKEVHERYHKIAEAHIATLTWAHKTQLDQTVRWDNFARWLCDPTPTERLFWIAGKAGSGKSTLVRYLYDHHLTSQMLQSWCGSRSLLLGYCFFWSAGTRLQKSQKGLLLALVDQLLSQYSNFTMNINPGRWRVYELGSTEHGEWSEWELKETLRKIIKEVAQTSRLCLFVDGLDEFDGSDEERLGMLKFLEELARSPDVKICVSSRPWTTFQDFFASTPQLLLEDLTRSDIELYVRQELLNNPAFAMLNRAEPENCSAFISEVVAKASGVFLWVRLVVRKLLAGLTGGDDIQDLQRELNSIPADLNTFFKQMMMDINLVHMAQASRMFRSACAAGEPLNLMTYCHLMLLSSREALEMSIQPLSREQVTLSLDRMARQINTRTKGLLEVHHKQGETAFLSAEVDFLHRTVRDFLLTPDTQHDIKQFEETSTDIHICLLRSFLIQLKTLDLDDFRTDFSDVCFLLNAAIRSAEDSDDSGYYEVLVLLEDVMKVVSRYRKQYKGPQMLSFRSYASEWWLSQREFDALFERKESFAIHFRKTLSFQDVNNGYV